MYQSVNTTNSVQLNVPTIAKPLPRNQYHPQQQQQQYGYSYPVPQGHQWGYPPNQYGYPPQYRYPQPPQHYLPPSHYGAVSYPAISQHHGYRYPPAHHPHLPAPHYGTNQQYYSLQQSQHYQQQQQQYQQQSISSRHHARKHSLQMNPISGASTAQLANESTSLSREQRSDTGEIKHSSSDVSSEVRPTSQRQLAPKVHQYNPNAPAGRLQPPIPPKQSEWRAVKDPTSDQVYYYNTATRETTWERPRDYVEKKAPLPPHSATSRTTVSVWRKKGEVTSPIVQRLHECMHYTPEVNSTARTGTWDDEEKRRLLLGIFLFGFSSWFQIQQVVATRSDVQVSQKARKWCPCMSNIKATGVLSTLEEVQTFYRQTLPKVEDIMNQLDIDKSVYQLDPVTKDAIERLNLLILPSRSEVSEEQWHRHQAAGIKQAQRLVPNKSESASSNISYELGSTHRITSNLDPDKIINIECAKSIFQNYMIRELEGRLESGTTVSVNRIIRRTADNKRVWSEVEYTIVKIEDSKLPATVVSSSASSNNSTNKIKVKGYTFPPSVNARYHVSLGDLLKIYGEASLQHLYNLNEVASLDTAKRVDQMSKDDPTRQHGGVYSFEFEESPSSLPLSPIIEEEEFIGDNEQTVEEEYSDDEDDPTEEEFSNDEPDEKKKEEKDKHGMTGSFGRRRDKYLFKGEDGKMYIRIDGEDLSIEADAGLCKLYDLLMEDVKNNPRVPPWIKRACIMLHEQGGDRFGAKKNIVYLLLEMALQIEDGHSVPGEMFQWDDTVFIGMVTKLMEALDALKPLFARFPQLRDVITAAMMSWPPCKDEDDRERVYNKPTATEYTGVDSMRDALDGPANPNAKTNEERYSKAYTTRKFNKAIDEIVDFVLEALKCVLSGCVFLLDKNDLACDKTRTSLHDILTSHGFEKVAAVYEHPNDIIIYMKGNAMIVVHGPLCVGGTIMVERFSLDDMLQRCLVIDTLRGIVCMAKGEEFNGPYLAIEAGMIQKLLVKGLHITREYGVPAAFFREYLNNIAKSVKRLGAVPKKVTTKNCFDSYGNGRIVHYPEYSISKVNRERYRRYYK